MRQCSIWLLLAAAISTSGYPAFAGSFDLRPAHGVLARLLPHQARQFELGTLAAAAGRERFRISRADDRIRVEGSAPLPLPQAVIVRSTPYSYRFALNENVDGYSAPYWSWPKWQREIDVLALSGINAVLIERSDGRSQTKAACCCRGSSLPTGIGTARSSKGSRNAGSG